MNYPLWKTARNLRLFWSLAGVLLAVVCSAQPMTLNDPILPPENDVAASSGLSPVAGYFFWYSSTNAVTNSVGTSPPANQDRVKAWGDLSTNNYVLQSLGGNASQPVFYSSGGTHTPPPSGVPYISFNIDNGVTITHSLTNKFPTTYAQPNTFFFAINIQGRTGGALLNGASDQNQQIIPNPPPGSFSMYAGTVRNGANIVQSADRWDIWTFQFNGASSLIRSNGVAFPLGGTTVGTGGLKGVTLGNFYNSTFACLIGLSEVFGYNSALSPADMLKQEEFMAHNVGISTVP